MKKLFKSEQEVRKYLFTNSHVPKEHIEKRIIMEFFEKLPFESLKKLINFQEIDFENNELWNDYEKRELLYILRDRNVVQYTCELYLDADS